MYSSSSTARVGNLPPIAIKLDGTNYPLWLAQVVRHLKGRNFMGYVDGTKPCPAYFLTDDQGKSTFNVDPAFDAWIHVDRTIQNWINALLTPSVFSTVADSASSRTTWVSLERHYASPINTRVLQLCGELLHAARADYVSTAAYLNKINSIADNLRLAGSPIADRDLVIIVMNAFPTYEFSTTAITFDYLQKVLLNLEKHLTQPGVPVYSLEPATAPIPASPYRGSGVDPGGSSQTVGPSSTTNANVNGNSASPSNSASRPSPVGCYCCIFGSPKVLT
ncbi:PREDICTED: UBN2_3 domain-containing [Prunus dulcis]|uniref:PREDICTED: UBN2_3 domain-containing n=1 Tax=Prunus dulcis TaxID=3755 RepID=A0A5E4FFH4_PRUDU|nr:hypothetical protein L3X38_044495 [Prunus dulcis]VVA26647.1 PREDICTED: UBN2_3 domain-containing [Prunus dulcis]